MESRNPEAGVFRFAFLIDGRPAFYTIGYHGERSEPRRVDEDETEAEVIDDLADALWLLRPASSSMREKGVASGQKPFLRLL